MQSVKNSPVRKNGYPLIEREMSRNPVERHRYHLGSRRIHRIADHSNCGRLTLPLTTAKKYYITARRRRPLPPPPPPPSPLPSSSTQTRPQCDAGAVVVQSCYSFVCRRSGVVSSHQCSVSWRAKGLLCARTPPSCGRLTKNTSLNNNRRRVQYITMTTTVFKSADGK